MRHRVLALLVPIGLLAATSASAQLPAPQGAFGENTAITITFGGTGIPHDELMYGGVGGSTLALGAHNRCSTGLANDRAGTYFATPGRYNPDGLGCSDLNIATWNFNFYIGGANTSLYSYMLLYDVNPGLGTTFMGSAIPSTYIVNGVFQGSENLGFPYLGANFDYDAAGVYSFELTQWDIATGGQLDRVAMNVSVTPEPATMLLLGTGLLGLAAAGLRRRKVRSAEV